MSICQNDLKQYRALCAEIHRREERLQRRTETVHDVVQGSERAEPYNLRRIHIAGDVPPPGADEERKRIALMKIRKREIEEYCEKISDYRISFAISKKYLDPAFGEIVTWEMVADELNDGATGDSIRQLVFRHFRRYNRS